VSTQQEKAERFLALHHGDGPLLMPNAWDAGSARLFEWMGFDAVATTSSGFAATLARLDGSTSRDEALTHAAALVAAVDVPISADLENCYAHDAAGVAETIAGAREAGLAGCSVEDFTGDRDDPIYAIDAAVERVAAAAEEAHRDPVRLVLTARAENFVHERPDLDDAIERLQRFQAAGADVLFAPGVHDSDSLRRLVSSVDLPVNVLVRTGMAPVAELAALGVRRISVGGSFAYAALAAAIDAATELRDEGTYGYFERAMSGITAVRQAFGP
jgi:2-methylisocitrate lyase-like PEP mutase family enzyme